MHVNTYSAEDFLSVAGPFLIENEIENGLFLGQPRRFAMGEAPYPWLACAEADGQVLGVAMRTAPPHRLALSRAPEEAITALCDAAVVGGVADNGFLSAAEVAPTALSRLGPLREFRKLGLYQLQEVMQPEQVSGSARWAMGEEADLLARWVSAFSAEIGHGTTPTDQARDWVNSRLAEQSLMIWTDSGQAVTMANMGSPTPNTMKINAVFTPPELRRRGYASACVAALSQAILDRGFKFACLYTDLSNTTSNAIYQRLGYQWVCESVEYAP